MGSEVSSRGSPFVEEWIARLGPSSRGTKRALDVAMGRGRHAVTLARAGFQTFGVDIRFEAVRDGASAAQSAGTALRAWCADLTPRATRH